MAFNIVLLVLAFLFMEFVAWASHKYVMHGFLWKWHADHHRKDHMNGMPLQTEDKHFEKNDLFFIIYAMPGILLMILGFSFSYQPFIFISIGITLYGFTYFTIHDVIIHSRVKSFLKNAPKIRFIKAIINAHTAHHKPRNTKDFNNYGLLFFPRRYFKEK